MFVTLLVFQFKFLLKLNASKNANSKLVTLLVFHELISPLKFNAPLKIPDISVTFPTFQLFKS